MSDCGLSSTGFMSTVGGSAAGQCLQRRRAADLAAVGGDCRIVRHVLRLERAHDFAAIGEQAAQPRDQQRLADVRAAALDHQRGHSTSLRQPTPARAPRATRKLRDRSAMPRREIARCRAAAGSEQRSFVHHAFIGRRAAELDAECARHRGFRPARVRRCVARRIAPHHPQSAAARKDDQQSREPRGDEIGQVVRARSRPAERAPARLAMTDETVGGVQRLVREQSRQSADREPEGRRDDPVVEAFREAFDCGGSDA